MASARGLRRRARRVEGEIQGLRTTRENISLRREQRQIRREARIKRAQIVSAAANAGSLEASGTIGETGSIQSQLGERIGTASTLTRFARKEGTLLQRHQALLEKADKKEAKKKK